MDESYQGMLTIVNYDLFVMILTFAWFVLLTIGVPPTYEGCVCVPA